MGLGASLSSVLARYNWTPRLPNGVRSNIGQGAYVRGAVGRVVVPGRTQGLAKVIGHVLIAVLLLDRQLEWRRAHHFSRL